MNNITQMEKWQELLEILIKKKKIAIACSGGLDSRLLSFAAHISGVEYQILHINGVHIPQNEKNILADFSKQTGILIKSFDFDPLTLKEVENNTIERCYHCKKAIFSFLLSQSTDYTLCDGSNTDDLKVYRPGLKALQELNISSPFVEANISKQDIKSIAKAVALPLPEQASQACLLTRFDYNILIHTEDLLWIDSLENALAQYIPYPFRVRASLDEQANTVFELHIEAEKEQLTAQLPHITNTLANFAQKNDKVKDIKLLFTSSLRGYFDKKSNLS